MGSATSLFFVSLVAIGVWVLMLSILTVRMVRHYNHLTSGVTPTGLRVVLETILAGQEQLKKQTDRLTVVIEKVIARNRLHLQHVGIVRFNPFSDTGGAQSFTLALMDDDESGIVITSLYARTGNRWYVKHVERGKGKDVALSKEEEAAIKQAKQR